MESHSLLNLVAELMHTDVPGLVGHVFDTEPPPRMVTQGLVTIDSRETIEVGGHRGNGPSRGRHLQGGIDMAEHTHTLWTYDDGGRAAAGFRGEARDCVTRAVAIATGLDYRTVYDDLNEAAQYERPRKGRKRSSARTGVQIPTIRKYLSALGWEWTPTMGIGTGCTVHLAAAELPAGRLIVNVSRHTVAVIDGVIRDTHDPTRDGTRCVYGFFSQTEPMVLGDSIARWAKGDAIDRAIERGDAHEATHPDAP